MIDKCTDCDGKGFIEEESGVVSPHMPYEVEIITDICGSCCGGVGRADKEVSND